MAQEPERSEDSEMLEAMLNELGESERALFERVHRLDCGCSLLGVMDRRPLELRGLQDLAYEARVPGDKAAADLRELVRMELVRHVQAAGIDFYGLNGEPGKRDRVARLFRWQRQWHNRLAEMEGFVDGRILAGGER